MGAFLTAPKQFTILSAPALATALATNLGLDHPGRVWRSTSATTLVIDIQGDASTIDTVALCGSDLTAADTISVRTAATQAALGSATPVSKPAVTGFVAPGASTITYLAIPAQAFRFVRITITLPTARTVTAQRLVVGQSVTSDGLDYDAEQSFEDTSLAIDGQSYSAFEEYPTLTSWKFKISRISNDDWRTKWNPLLRSVGRNKGLLFVPDDQAQSQSDMIFGRITSTASGQAAAYDWWVANLQITALAP